MSNIEWEFSRSQLRHSAFIHDNEEWEIFSLGDARLVREARLKAGFELRRNGEFVTKGKTVKELKDYVEEHADHDGKLIN